MALSARVRRYVCACVAVRKGASAFSPANAVAQHNTTSVPHLARACGGRLLPKRPHAHPKPTPDGGGLLRRRREAHIASCVRATGGGDVPHHAQAHQARGLRRLRPGSPGGSASGLRGPSAHGGGRRHPPPADRLHTLHFSNPVRNSQSRDLLPLHEKLGWGNAPWGKRPAAELERDFEGKAAERRVRATVTNDDDNML